MRRLHLFCSAALFAACLAAHADTISAFNINGTSLVGDGKTVTGNLTVDITTGVVQSVSFTAGGVFESGVDSQSGPDIFVGVDKAKLSIDGGSLILYMGSSFDLNGPNELYVGHITAGAAPTVTPEPSSLALLGVPLLGIAGLLRRRARQTSLPPSA